MKKPNIEATNFARTMMGIIALAFSWELIEGLRSGVFELGGEAYARIDRPLVFWANAIFNALVILLGFSVALLGRDQNGSSK